MKAIKILICTSALLFAIVSCKKDAVNDEPVHCQSCLDGEHRSFFVKGNVTDSTGAPFTGAWVSYEPYTNGSGGELDSLGNYTMSVTWIEGGQSPINKPDSIGFRIINDSLYLILPGINTSNVEHLDTLTGIDLVI